MSKDSGKYSPFSNATEFYPFYDANCAKCKKERECDILTALFDTTMTQEQYNRLGGDKELKHPSGIPYWPGDIECQERRPR